MTRLIRRLFGSDAAARRLLAGLCGVFLLVSILFSSLFVVAEADHDCVGEDCPVCLQIQASLDGVQQTGLLPRVDVAVSCTARAPADRICAWSYRAPATTLQSLDVRMDE